MSRGAVCAAVLVGAWVLIVGALADGKTTVEPAMSPTSATAPSNTASAVDERLSKKVTYEATGVRLHHVLEGLSRQTGLVINCGLTDSDWQVRDIPVVVSARDLPLGVLLQAIADCTHLHLSTFKDRDTWTYRMWRDKKHRELLEGYVEARAQAARAAATWDWDTWSKLNDLGSSDSSIPPEYAALSRLFAALGPEGRDRVIAGEAIQLTLQNTSPSMRDDLLAAFQGSWKGYQDPTDPTLQSTTQHLAEAEYEQSFILTIKFGQYDNVYADGLSVEIEKLPRHGNPLSGACMGPVLFRTVVERLRDSGRDIAPRPEIPPPPTDEGLDRTYTRLVWRWSKEPKSPLLDAKGKLEPPKDKQKVTFAYLLVELAKATGLTIVSDDFRGHNTTEWAESQLRKRYFGREMSIGDFVESAGLGSVWRADEKNRVIIGSDQDWSARHRNLVPESVLKSVQERLDKEGFDDPDDFESLAKLTKGQRMDWITNPSEFAALRHNAWEMSDSLWELYYSLTRADRARAKSKSGVSLSSVDPALLKDVFRRRWASLTHSTPASARYEPLKLPTERDRLGDISTLSHPVMRIVKSNHWADKKHNWNLTIEGERDGRKVSAGTYLADLPIYSPKREQELAGSR